jgi:hypothetical protein
MIICMASTSKTNGHCLGTFKTKDTFLTPPLTNVVSFTMTPTFSLFLSPPPPPSCSTYDFLAVSFLLAFPPKTLYASILSPMRATCPANFILLDLIVLIRVSLHSAQWEYGSCQRKAVSSQPLPRATQVQRKPA